SSLVTSSPSLVTRHCAHRLPASAFSSSFEYQVEREQRRARADRGVRDVAGRRLVRAYVDLYEVYHVAEPHAVAEVPRDAREQQRHRAEYSVVRALRAEEVCEEPQGGEPREPREQPAAELAALLHVPERDAGVLRVRELNH